MSVAGGGHDPAHLVALVGSRICHDLISPLGAIGNGVELMGLAGGGGGAELALISDSVDSATARIRFFRIAYGMATADQVLPRGEVVSILDGVTRGGRLRLDWQPREDIPRTEARLAFLLLQCLDTALPYGGAIVVRREAAAWRLTAESDKLRCDPALWEILSAPGGGTGLSPGEVQFALAPLVAAEAGRRIAVEAAPGRIAVAF